MKNKLIAAMVMISSISNAQYTVHVDNASTEYIEYPPRLEQDYVGPYNQPEWTTYRRFPTTRVYLQTMPWEFGMEQWLRSKINKDKRTTHRLQTEAEIGLPGRLQFDIYVNSVIDKQGTWRHDNIAPEMRWALANWGVIPLNPTLYAEYKIMDEGNDRGEVKLLLGDQFVNGWAFAYNTSYEWEFGGEEYIEYAQAIGISKSIINKKLSLGLEALYTSESIDGSRGTPEIAFSAGPSVQYRFNDHSSLNITPLFGISDDAADISSYIVYSHHFGSVKNNKKVSKPVSSGIE